MKSCIWLKIFTAGLILSGCSVSERKNDVPSTFNQMNIAVRNKNVLTNRQTVSSETVPVLVENISLEGDFKFKVICDLSDKKGYATRQANKKTEKYVCPAGKLKFTVVSTRSDAGVRDDFESLKRENRVAENKSEGLTFIEYGLTETTKHEVPNFPEAEEIKYQSVWNKVYLIDNNWMIHFEALCTAYEPEYCKISFAQSNPAAREFFKSLEILKK